MSVNEYVATTNVSKTEKTTYSATKQTRQIIHVLELYIYDLTRVVI